MYSHPRLHLSHKVVGKFKLLKSFCLDVVAVGGENRAPPDLNKS